MAGWTFILLIAVLAITSWILRCCFEREEKKERTKMPNNYGECDNGYYISDITDDDLGVVERWLIKVNVIDENVLTTVSGDELVSKKLVLELIARFSPEDTMVLGFEVEKLPVVYLPYGDECRLRSSGNCITYYTHTKEKNNGL